MNKYHSVLRLHPDVNPQDIIEKAKRCDKGIDEIIIFTQGVHAVRALDELEKFAETIRPILAELKQMGFKAGIDHLCTIGHMGEHVDERLSDMDMMYINWCGKRDGCLCTTSEKTFDYIRKSYQILAELNPDSIYADDDLDYLFCECESCTKIFKEKYFSGIEFDTIKEALEHSDINVRKASRHAWLRFNSDRITNI